MSAPLLSLAVILLVPPDTAPELSAAAVQSCNAALGPARCATAEAEEPARYYAVLQWEDQYQRLRIDLRAVERGRALLDSRELSFEERDAPRHRWAAAGLVVAALVAARQPTEDEPAFGAESRGKMARGVPREESGVTSALSFLALTGPGLDRGPFRFGAATRASIQWRPLPLLSSLELRYARRPGTPTIDWMTPSLAIGGRIGGWESTLAAEVQTAFVLQRTWIRAFDPVSHESDSAARLSLGTRFELDLYYTVAPKLSAMLGAEMTATRPEISIEVQDEPAGTEQAIRWAVSAGVRVTL